MRTARLLVAGLVLAAGLGWSSPAEGRSSRRGSRALGEFLFVRHPYLGIPLLVGIIALNVWSGGARRSQRLEARRQRARGWLGERGAVREELATPWDRLQRADPAITRDALRDFVSRLAARFQEAQGAGEPGPDALRPYLATWVLDQLRGWGSEHRRRGRRVVDVQVSGVDVPEVDVREDGAMAFRADVTLTYGLQERRGEGAPLERPDGRVRRYSLRQVWRLERDAGAGMPRPGVLPDLGCPACARAPARTTRDGACEACGADVRPGRVTWRLVAAAVQERVPLVDGRGGGGLALR